MKKDIEKEIVSVVEKECRLKFNKKDNRYLDYKFSSDLSLDSLGIVEIIMNCENKFKIKIDDDDIMNIKTINDLIIKIKTILENE